MFCTTPPITTGLWKHLTEAKSDSYDIPGVLHGSLFYSQPGSPRFEPSLLLWVFRGGLFGQDTSKPWPSTGKTQKKT